jgi:hypothetical protein
MSDWWWWVLVAIAVIVVAAFVVMRRRNAGAPDTSANTPTPNYREERETGRLGGMSAEDRAWETASLERNRKREEQEPPPRSG